MLINTQELKNLTNKILAAVDSSEISDITESLEMEIEDNNLYIYVTNKEYFVKVRLFLGYNESFHATVNAKLFLNLISQITTEDISMECDEKYLHIKGNGSYKIPLIYDGAELLKLPKIMFNCVDTNMDIDTSILQSIAKYNSKEISKGYIVKPIQKMYYIDEKGAITFTTGACVNNFTLEKPVKMLLTSKIVKLFKLFNEDKVFFVLGHDVLGNDSIQTKVMFKDNTTELTAILQCDDTMLRSMPVTNIRNRAEHIYPYSTVVNKSGFVQAINRLMVFINMNGKTNDIRATKFIFDKDKVTIEDETSGNIEYLNYTNNCNLLESPYETYFDLNDIKLTLQACDEEYLTLNFGDSNALVIARANILNVIPECHH